MMGITDGRKDFDFNQVITCDECGRYGRPPESDTVAETMIGT